MCSYDCEQVSTHSFLPSVIVCWFFSPLNSQNFCHCLCHTCYKGKHEVFTQNKQAPKQKQSSGNHTGLCLGVGSYFRELLTKRDVSLSYSNSEVKQTKPLFCLLPAQLKPDKRFFFLLYFFFFLPFLPFPFLLSLLPFPLPPLLFSIFLFILHQKGVADIIHQYCTSEQLQNLMNSRSAKL